MLIVASLYVLLIWLVFFRFRLLPWNWAWRSISTLLGIMLLLVVIGLLNFFTPSGRVVVMGRVVEVAPSVSGKVTEILVEPNRPVQKGQALFRIDARTYEYEVARLEAALAEAEQNVKRLASDLLAAEADVRALRAELKLAEIKKRDIETLVKKQARAEVELEKASTELASLKARLDAATARETNTRLALESVIGGEQTTVAQIRAQLDQARWKLGETTVHAPSDGFVSGLTLAVGQRATPLRSVMAFIEADSIRINGVFPQSGFRRIAPGARVRLALAGVPGRIYESEVREVFSGIGQGQIAASGVLPSMGSIGASREYGVRLVVPDDLPPETLRLGMSGTATVFAEDAGAIGFLASILLWINAYVLYL